MMRCYRTREELKAMGLTDAEIETLMKEEAYIWRSNAESIKCQRRVTSTGDDLALQKVFSPILSFVYFAILALGALCAWPIALPGIILRYLYLRKQLNFKKKEGKEISDDESWQVTKWGICAWVAAGILVLCLIADNFGC